ncbi:MAG: DUF2946 family protein [Pseudomonadota bacterium]
MILKWRIKRVGHFTAWAAAYALVFNVMLTSAALATVSPYKLSALHELCLSGGNLGGGSTTPDVDGSTTKSISHCPLCVSTAMTADLPPQPPALAIRIALHALFEPARQDHIVARFAASDHQPRGPPHHS